MLTSYQTKLQIFYKRNFDFVVNWLAMLERVSVLSGGLNLNLNFFLVVVGACISTVCRVKR